MIIVDIPQKELSVVGLPETNGLSKPTPGSVIWENNVHPNTSTSDLVTGGVSEKSFTWYSLK